MSKASNYMDLPTELKLKILCNLDNKDVKQSRMVCKRFVLRNIGIAFAEYQQKYLIKTRLNLSSKVDTFTSVDWNIMMEYLRGFYGQSSKPLPKDPHPDQRYFYLESIREVQTIEEVPEENLEEVQVSLMENKENLEEVPVSLMENNNWFFLVDSQDNPPLLTNLDIENFTRIKLCIILLFTNCPQVSEKLAKMFSSSQTELTHLMFGTLTMEFDCVSLHDCNRLEYLDLFSGLSVKNLDQLPTSLKTLNVDVPMGVDIPQLEWISENLLELQDLGISVNEENGEFSVEMFKDLCNLPSLTRMLLTFPLSYESDTAGPKIGTLLKRLEEMRNLCFGKGVEGINAVYSKRPDRRPNRDPLDILIEFEVKIQRLKEFTAVEPLNSITYLDIKCDDCGTRIRDSDAKNFPCFHRYCKFCKLEICLLCRNEHVLSYFDYSLREGDLALLKGSNWLNDTLIGFYFEYLSNSVGVGPKTCHFVGPEVTQLLKLMPKEQVPIVLPTVLDGILLHEYTMFAVNDSDDSTGGAHWSLLVYSKADQKFIHYDTHRMKLNTDAAKKIAEQLKNFTGGAAFLNNENCNCQINSYDCGCHVIKTAQLIFDFVNDNTGASLLVPLCPTATPMDASEMRTEFVALVLKLKQNAEPKN